jgi:N utilization substance protein B
MQSRRASRQAALQVLYRCDAVNDYSLEGVNFLIAHFERCAALDEAEEQLGLHYCEYLKELVHGVLARLPEIDSQIGVACVNWTLSRMARIDRNILRIATFEMLHRPDVPANVSINEAIEIAKVFAAVDSPQFINGVLDRLSRIHALKEPLAES